MLTGPEQLPRYPGPLPGGVNRGLTVQLSGFDREAAGMFAAIEKRTGTRRRTRWCGRVLVAPQAATVGNVPISAESSASSPRVRSVSGGRTGPAPWPVAVMPALTMLTA